MILLINGIFIWLIEYTSEANSSSSLLSKFDTFFYGYRIFLIMYVIIKFMVLLGEIVLSSYRMNKILKSIETSNLFQQSRNEMSSDK